LSPVTLTPGLVFVAHLKGLAVLDAANGAELWSDRGVNGGLFSQPVVANGILHATYYNGDLVAWSTAATGGGIPILTTSQNSLPFFYTGGGPAPPTQTVSITATSSASFTVASDSPWLTSDIQAGTTPATITVRADPSGLDPGVYTGILSIQALGNKLPVQVVLVVNPALPFLDPAGIVNAASDQAGLAPGEMFTLFADNLSAGTLSAAAGGPWPNTWRGISVKINGIGAPLGLVSPSQINAQVPYEIAPGTATLTIQSNGAKSGEVSLAILPASPGIFVDDAGRAAATNQDGTLNQPENPASTGSVISVYLTGQGLVDPPVDTGAVTPLDALRNTVAETTATIGGVPASVSFSGLAPGFVGLCQVNLVVPDGPLGDQPVIVTIGGAASNAAIVTIGK
jgi:adhesin/invasin